MYHIQIKVTKIYNKISVTDGGHKESIVHDSSMVDDSPSGVTLFLDVELSLKTDVRRHDLVQVFTLGSIPRAASHGAA